MPQPVNPELLAYQDLTPEVGRFIGDFILVEAEEWFTAVVENCPAAYRGFSWQIP